MISGVRSGSIPTPPRDGRGRPRMELSQLRDALRHGAVTERSSCADIMAYVTWVRE